MFKKTLIVGAVALGLTSVAFANGAARISKCTTFMPGVYVGLQAGYAATGWQDAVKVQGIHDDFTTRLAGGITGRAFIGYDFHKNFAVEFGYMRDLQKTKIMAAEGQVDGMLTHGFDLVLKGKIPLNDKIGVYGKGGIGYLMTTFNHDQHGSGQVHRLTAVYGFGINYNTYRFSVTYLDSNILNEDC